MNIRVDLNTPIKDGTEVVFRSPVDCSQITGLIVYYNGESKEFAFADAHGNNVGDIDHLFAENAVVKVILDLETNMAFVQNADTNAYLEGRFSALDAENKALIDKLCPSFTESGAIVACEPLEGYPLEVAWQTKNLINPTAFLAASSNTTLDGDVFTTNFASGALFINHKGSRVVFPAGQYTLTYVAVSETVNMNAYVYSTIDGSTIASKALGNHYNISKFSFTADVPFYLSIGGLSAGSNLGTYSFKLQLEKGTTATAYEPYAETATITRCGKNLMTYDTVDTASTSANKILWSGKLKPPYVISGDISQYKIGNQAGLIECGWEDGTTTAVSASMLGIGYTNTKTLTRIVYRHWDSGSGVAKLQLETGTTATDFEPYNGGTFVPGEPIPAIQGVNTIFADAGLVTVKGKADPGALINKLTNAILSLGGNV